MRTTVVGVVEQIGVAFGEIAAKAMAPTKIGRPDVPCTKVAPVSA